jgi:hypothetical protein
MKISEINQIIDNVVAEEVRRTILKESKENKKEVYHIKCEGVPLATFDTEAEAKENLPQYKAKHKGELIIEKGIYESQDDMLDKLDEMNDELEETDNMKNTEMNEKLVGNQSKLDKNHNGKIDGQDFKIMKGQKNEAEECYECSANMDEELHGDQDKIDADNDGKISANDFKLLLKKKKEGEIDEENGAGDGMDVYGIWEKYSEAAMNEHSPETFSDEFEYADNVISYIVQDAITNGDVSEEDEEELVDELKDTYGYDLFDMFQAGGGDGFEDDEEEEEIGENKGTCNECGGMMNEEGVCNECSGMMNEGGEMFGSFDDEHGWYDQDDRKHGGDFDFDYDEEEFEDFPSMYDKIGEKQKWFAPGEEGQKFFDTYKKKYDRPFKVRTRRGNIEESKKKRTIRVTESELVQMIANMVNESIPGLETFKKAHRESGKQNKEGIDAMMKDVNKNHIDVEGNDKPEFPHAIGKGEKVARKNTKQQEDEIAKNFAGLQNLDYDNEPDEKFKQRLKMAIEGDKLMGNAPTTEKTDVKPTNGSKLGEVSKDKDGNSIPTPKTGKGIEKQMKDRQKDKDERVLYKKEAVPTNESKISFNDVLLEELNKMKSLSSYNKKTQ